MRLSLRFLTLASAVIGGLAFTQAASAQHVMHVPFTFKAGDKTLPAGEYRVQRDLNGHLVTLENTDKLTSYTYLLSLPGEQSHKGVALLFDRSGSTYILNSIVVNDRTTGKLDKSFTKERYESRGQ